MKIAVYNNKGGVGKTSLVAHVGFRAIEKHQVITILDADRQHNAIDWMTGGNWDGNITITNGAVTVTTDAQSIDNSGLLVIDCPPAFEIVENFRDVDIWLVPVGNRFSMMGAMTLLAEIKEIQINPRVVLIPNMVDLKTPFGTAKMKEIHKLGIEVFKYSIPRHDAVGKAEMSAKAVWQIPYGIRSLAAQNLMVFADWVLSGCKEKGVYNV